MEVKIEIPDNCELIKEGDSYIVRERQSKPRSWEEFCEKFPIIPTEHYIDEYSDIISVFGWTHSRCSADKNLCVSREEAEAFLALIQLRQLRKVWIGDWELTSNKPSAIIFYNVKVNRMQITYSMRNRNGVLSFPTEQIAKEFLECFKDLINQAKLLL